MEEGSFLDPILSAVRWLWALIPTKLSMPRISFITVHYMYIISMTIIGSVIIFPKGMPYIDALFFAAGSATQSGLNTIDVNDLYLYQQVTFYLIACICTPVWIHSTLVIVRLYWFEKRFAKVVREQRSLRKLQAKTLTRSKSEARTVDEEYAPRGAPVDKDVTVIRGEDHLEKISGEHRNAAWTPLKKDVHTDEQSSLPDMETDRYATCGGNVAAVHSEDVIKPFGSTEQSRFGPYARMHREITFADEIPTSGLPAAVLNERLPARGSDMTHHIEFLQRQQRNAHREGGTLHIPGPRDFDRGAVPRELSEPEDENRVVRRVVTGESVSILERQDDRMSALRSPTTGEDEHVPGQRTITIDLPERPARRRNSDVDTEPSSPSLVKRIRSNLTHRPSYSRLSISKVRETLGRSFSMNHTVNSATKIEDPMPYLSWQATTGRNSAFMGLSSEQRDELGGIEYRSLKMLLKILIGYFFGFHILGAIIMVPWILNTHWRETVLTQYAINPTWWGLFTAASMFNDLGLTLTPTSMNEFNTATLPLLFGSYLVIIGNTGFPCMLRFMIWIISKCYRKHSPGWDELRFLLDHPRRCFTLLFPSKATWWLFWILVLLNGIDLLFFIVLDLNDPVVTAIPVGYRILDGWFQAVSTRTAGFSCINLAGLHPAIQVSYLIMMYISVFPIAISVRRTNVYEEKSLGLWSGEENAKDDQDPSYVGQHLRRQLSFDLWYVFLGAFIIAIVEGDRIANNTQYGFTMFAVLFEIVSAYGTVGLSLGYPGINASFSAEFRTISKLVIVAMMIRGRHRGLPYALDRAILLPSDKLHRKDEEDNRRAPLRRTSIVSEHRSRDVGRNWQDTELDDQGLPVQHTAAFTDPTLAGAGMRSDLVNLRRVNQTYDRGSDDCFPDRRARRRSRSLGQVIVSGLSAGPTWPRRAD